jgi:ribosomal protein S27AE
MAFYNAFSEEGLPLYEVDVEEDHEPQETTAFCPQCGNPVGEDDQYCRHCGASLT